MAGKAVVNQIQLGDSSTATHNFVWQTNADGSCKLARGNAGATTQDILTVAADGKVSMSQSYAVVNAVDTVNYLAAANTTLQARIQGVVTGGAIRAGTNSTTGAHVVGVVTGSACVVDAFHNGSTPYMATTLTFPTSGTYVVSVQIISAGYGANTTNTLIATAIKVGI